MKLEINPRSKTLWLQGLLALAAIFFPDHIAEMCAAAGDESVRNVVLAQCALTAVAYVVKFRSTEK